MILVKHNFNTTDPFVYFALEEYVLNYLLKENETYFFTWQIQGVVIGKNQVVQNEVNLAYLKANKIKLFRRPSGGGAVYADLNNNMFSIIANRTKEPFSFQKHLSKIVNVLNDLGLPIYFSGRNDLMIKDKKISGNAFLQNQNGMLLHGTLMYDCDIAKMVEVLTVGDGKLLSKGIKSVKSRVLNLKELLSISNHELIDYLETNLCDTIYHLTDHDVQAVIKLSHKYAKPNYIWVNQPLFTHTLEKRFTYGNLILSFVIEHNLIKDFMINGDFFELNNLNDYTKKFLNVPYQASDIINIIDTLVIGDYILGANNLDIIDLIKTNVTNIEI